MTLTTRLLIAVCMGLGIGVLAAMWRGRSFAGWSVAGGVASLISPPEGAIVAAVVAFAALRWLGGDDDDDGFSLPSIGGDD